MRRLKVAAALLVLACVAAGLVVYAVRSDGDGASAPQNRAPEAAGRTGAQSDGERSPRAGARDVDDRPLGSREAARVREAALRVTGGGTVVEMDRSDDPGETYEIEVVRRGREIDVALDDRLLRVPNVRYDGSGGEPED